MKVRLKGALNARQGKPITVYQAVTYSLSDPDPMANAVGVSEILARLISTLADKGVLLPHETVYVIGQTSFEEC